MSKKDKKKLQQNLSLKERLEKHWNNRNWAAFVSLFLRDREASMRTTWASRWDDGLYNCLTNAFFVEKDFDSVKMVLDLIRSERGISGVSPLLCDCMDVVSDFLQTWEGGAVPKPSRLLAEANLPSSYLVLRRELASLSSLRIKKSPQNDAEALVKKLATQYSRLGRAKTATPYVTWLKIAQELKKATNGAEYSDVFGAVHAIVGLVHKLVLTGKGENQLRKATSLLTHPIFRDIPPNQTHPVVKSLWEFFCRLGEQKYGKDWGDIARVLQLSFMKPAQPELEQLATQYERLTKIRRTEFLDNILQSALLIRGSQWTDQEHYILRMLFVNAFNEGRFDDPDITELIRFLGSFKTLGEIGRKWRPNAPWGKRISLDFEGVILGIPRKVLSTLSQWDLPYESMTAPTLLYFALLAPYGKMIKQVVTTRTPLRLSEKDMDYTSESLLHETLSRKDMGMAKSLLGDEGYVAFCEALVRNAIKLSAENVAENNEVSRQFWFSLRRDMIEELADGLLPDSLEKCFCQLYLDAKSMNLSKDPVKIEAFFKAESSSSKFAPLLWMVLLVWPGIDPHFLVRLFQKNYPLIQCEGAMNETIWEAINYMLTRIRPKAARDIVAVGVYNIMLQEKNHSSSFKNAIAFLKRLPKMTDAELERNERKYHDKDIAVFQKMRGILHKVFQKNKYFYEDF
jgi:hypothetical protein